MTFSIADANLVEEDLLTCICHCLSLSMSCSSLVFPPPLHIYFFVFYHLNTTLHSQWAQHRWGMAILQFSRKEFYAWSWSVSFQHLPFESFQQPDTFFTNSSHTLNHVFGLVVSYLPLILFITCFLAMLDIWLTSYMKHYVFFNHGVQGIFRIWASNTEQIIYIVLASRYPRKR